MEKNGGVNKRFASRTQKMHREANFTSLPLVPPLIPDKIRCFSFFHFLTHFELIISNWGEPHNLRSSLQKYKPKKMADDVRPRTRSSIGAPSRVQPPRKNVARSVGPAKTNADITNPSKNKNDPKKSPNPSTTHSTTTSPVKG